MSAPTNYPFDTCLFEHVILSASKGDHIVITRETYERLKVIAERASIKLRQLEAGKEHDDFGGLGTGDDAKNKHHYIRLLQMLLTGKDKVPAKCKTCGGSGWQEQYRDADEPCPHCDMGAIRYKECFGKERPAK